MPLVGGGDLIDPRHVGAKLSDPSAAATGTGRETVFGCSPRTVCVRNEPVDHGVEIGIGSMLGGVSSKAAVAR